MIFNRQADFIPHVTITRMPILLDWLKQTKRLETIGIYVEEWPQT